MKTMFRTLGLVAVTALFAVSCGASCEDKAADFATAGTDYSAAAQGTDCAAAQTAFDAYIAAYNDLCDESKTDGFVDAQTAAFDLWKAANSCE